jgi:hypothetical protein
VVCHAVSLSRKLALGAGWNEVDETKCESAPDCFPAALPCPPN